MNIKPPLLTSDPIVQLTWRIAVPASVGMFFNTMFNVVDTLCAGWLSTDALAALSLSFPLFFLFIAIGSGLAQGTILTQRFDKQDRTHGITCTGHADLVQAADGRWWMVFLGIRGEGGNSPMGRETFLEPVDWSGIWPIVNPSHPGRADFEITAIDSVGQRQTKSGFHTDFKDQSLSPEWSMIRTPDSPWWTFPKNKRGISLQLRPDEITGTNQPSFLGIRITEPNCSFSTRLTFKSNSPEQCAGIAIERSSAASWMLVVETPESGPVASVYEGTNCLKSTPIKADASVDLRISMKFPELAFDWKQGTNDWETITICEAPSIATAPPGHFTGAMVGLYASSRGKESDHSALFDFIDYDTKPSGP